MTTPQPSFPDPIAAGIARGWRVHDGAALADGTIFECDVAIVGQAPEAASPPRSSRQPG